MSVSSSVGKLTYNSSSMSSSIWILDFGASYHMSPNSTCFASVSHLSSIPIMIVDDTFIPLVGVGFVTLQNPGVR